MQPTSLSRSAGRIFVFLCASALAARAQTTTDVAGAHAAGESIPLDRFVVSASRTLQDPANTPSSVSVVPVAELELAQIGDLRSALGREPGVVVVSTGGAGGPSAIYLRGSNAHHTLFVVDGVRMNDRAASYNNFLGSADLVNVGRLEILRGPQSTLYGSSAMGGIILIDTVQGCGTPTGSLSATAGSFDTYGGGAEISGGTAHVGYSAAAQRLVTANDAPTNELRQWSYSTRLEYAPTELVSVGATFRGQNDDYEQIGSRLFPAPGFVTSDNYLATVYGTLKVSETLSSKLTLGLHRRLYTFADTWGVSDMRNTRKVADWQTTWQATDNVEVVAGANYERSRFLVNGVRSKDKVGAGYVSGSWRPVEKITFTGGVRYDDFESVGSAVTWRSGVAWRPAAGTKLRATYGTGFAAPGSDDRYGVPQWGQLPNPDLDPEKSRGWDVGIDQEIFGKATLGLTYFHNRFRNLFEWEYVDFVTYQGRTVNRSRARTEGVEVSLDATLAPSVRTRISYTYLEAADATGARLARRPRHIADGEVRVQATKAFSIGAGLHLVSNRLERTGPIEDYTTVRVFSTYAVRENLLLKLRVENALDEEYEEVLGYASLPRGIFGGVEWRF
jgi:vitamin B12 transporter